MALEWQRFYTINLKKEILTYKKRFRGLTPKSYFFPTLTLGLSNNEFI